MVGRSDHRPSIRRLHNYRHHRTKMRPRWQPSWRWPVHFFGFVVKMPFSRHIDHISYRHLSHGVGSWEVGVVWSAFLPSTVLEAMDVGFRAGLAVLCSALCPYLPKSTHRRQKDRQVHPLHPNHHPTYHQRHAVLFHCRHEVCALAPAAPLPNGWHQDRKTSPWCHQTWSDQSTM